MKLQTFPKFITSGRTTKFITGIKYDSNQERCILCELASLKGMPTSLETYNKTVDREVDCIIYSSPNFYVTSELGALKQGYLMIVPKQHILWVLPNSIRLSWSNIIRFAKTSNTFCKEHTPRHQVLPLWNTAVVLAVSLLTRSLSSMLTLMLSQTFSSVTITSAW